MQMDGLEIGHSGQSQAWQDGFCVCLTVPKSPKMKILQTRKKCDRPFETVVVGLPEKAWKFI